MDLTAKPFRIFVAVAELRSFSRAAEQMNMSQPALSAQLRELERQLGFSLFERTSRRVELTAEGGLFLENARRMILEAEWTIRAASDIRSQPLRIGVAHHSHGVSLRRRLTDGFIVDNPEMPLRISARHPRQLSEQLEREFLDVVIAIEHYDKPQNAPTEAPDDEHIANGGTNRLVLGVRRMGLAVPSTHRLARTPAPSTEMLAGERIGCAYMGLDARVADAMGRALSAANAEQVLAPEGDPISTLRFAELTGTPCLDLGWFAHPSIDGPAKFGELVTIYPDWSLTTALVVLTSAERQRPATKHFVEYATKFVEPPTVEMSESARRTANGQ